MKEETVKNKTVHDWIDGWICPSCRKVVIQEHMRPHSRINPEDGNCVCPRCGRRGMANRASIRATVVNTRVFQYERRLKSETTEEIWEVK